MKKEDFRKRLTDLYLEEKMDTMKNREVDKDDVFKEEKRKLKEEYKRSVLEDMLKEEEKENDQYKRKWKTKYYESLLCPFVGSSNQASISRSKDLAECPWPSIYNKF